LALTSGARTSFLLPSKTGSVEQNHAQEFIPSMVLWQSEATQQPEPSLTTVQATNQTLGYLTPNEYKAKLEAEVSSM